ncbi:MAG: pyridoxal-phosphate dependent enzyme [Cloacibacillus evryensis]
MQKAYRTYIVETPLIRLQNLDSYLGCKVYASLNRCKDRPSNCAGGQQAADAFARAADRGIVAASSGNHGKALSYAAGLLGVKCTSSCRARRK